MTDPRFEEVRRRAATAIGEDGVRSAYVGLVRENGHHEYHFGDRTSEAAELRELAAVQLGMLLSVLSERSDSDAEELAELALDRAERLELR